MRHTEFWARMEQTFGETYARFWAKQHVLAALDDRTVEQALDDGIAPKQVWAAVHRDQELPESEK